jgi:hypothetical protein
MEKKRGGKRKGAGRPALGKKRLVVRVTPKTFSIVCKAAKARVISRGEFVDSLL